MFVSKPVKAASKFLDVTLTFQARCNVPPSKPTISTVIQGAAFGFSALVAYNI